MTQNFDAIVIGAGQAGPSLAGRLTYLAWKGRDAVTSGAAFCKKLINAA